MNPRLTIRRHGRTIGVVGALVAVSATATMALVAGTATAAPSASKPGTCVDNVNVRAEPTTVSKIVAVCTAGKTVRVAETRDGFVHITDLGGWAAQEYVSVNGAKPAPSQLAPTPRVTGGAASDDPAGPSTGPTPGMGVDGPRVGDDADSGDADVSDTDGTDDSSDATDADPEQPTPGESPRTATSGLPVTSGVPSTGGLPGLGGLLG